jgi:hypothetical protein
MRIFSKILLTGAWLFAFNSKSMAQTANTAPIATAQNVSAVKNKPGVQITLAGTDVEENPLTFAVLTQPKKEHSQERCPT